MSGLRLALGMFTVLPAGHLDADARTAARAVRWLPAIGALVGGLSVAPALLTWHGHGHGSALVAAVVVIGLQALLTRGLHLDGLADLADGLGSGRPVDGALDVMRRSDIGPFGVAAVLLTVLLQVACLAAVLDSHGVALAVVLTATGPMAGRLAVVWAARRGVPPARPDGFGALVASSVEPPALASITVLVLAGLGVAAWAAGSSARQLGWLLAAVLAALLVTVALTRHVVRRLGGTTGDVFGALVEVGSGVALLVLAAEPAWR